jgi:hypothetical protein
MYERQFLGQTFILKDKYFRSPSPIKSSNPSNLCTEGNCKDSKNRSEVNWSEVKMCTW